MRFLLRLVVFLALLSVFVAAAVWLADHPGAVTLEWLGWRVSTSMAMLVGILLAVAFLLVLAWRLVTAVLRLPRRVMRRIGERRREVGMRALADGLAAAAVGETRRALRLAHIAERKLADPSVTAVLTAQAAQLAGDEKRAEDQYRTLLARPETAGLGLRGLLKQAIDADDQAQAIELAQQARQSAPADPWVADTLFELLVKAGRIAEAEALVEDSERSGAMPSALVARRRALVLDERARLALAAGDSRGALAFSRRAVAADPGLPAAAARLATLYIGVDRRRRADAVLAKAWQHQRSPDLLRAIADELPLVRLYRLERMIDGAPLDADAALVLGETALEARLWGQARKHLQTAIGLRPSAAAYRLLAQLEEAEYANHAAAQAWLEKIATAPADPAWRCDNCGGTTLQWSPRCPHCGAIDRLTWPIAAPAATGTLPAESTSVQPENA